ncbi:MAG: hypothetical protein WBP82_02845, partial [Leuconostoc mesenteroides]
MEVEILPLTNEAEQYLVHKRKLTNGTLLAYRLGCNSRGEIVIPFYDENDELRAVKNRSPNGKLLKRFRYEEDGSKTEYEVKTDSVKGSKSCLLGSHLYEQ